MIKAIRKRITKSHYGSVLPFAIMIVILLAILGIGLIQLGQSARLTSAKTITQLAARAAADAGFTEAVHKMNAELAKGTWDGTPIPSQPDIALPNSDATYSYTVTKESDSVTNESYYLVSATGKDAFFQKNEFGRLYLESLLFGIGVKEGIDVKVDVNFKVPKGKKFALRTNSIADNAIILKSGIVVPGDVVCGPGGDTQKVVDTKATTVITGDVYSASDKIDFPSVVVPADLVAAPVTKYVYKAGTPIVGSGDPCHPAVIKFDTIDIPQSGSQQIQGYCKIYVMGSTILRQSAELIVTNGASLRLYLGSFLEAKNSNGIDNLNSDIPDTLKIYGLDSCKYIDLKAKGDVLFGYVYAPEADLNVYAKNEIAVLFAERV